MSKHLSVNCGNITFAAARVSEGATVSSLGVAFGGIAVGLFFRLNILANIPFFFGGSGDSSEELRGEEGLELEDATSSFPEGGGGGVVVTTLLGLGGRSGSGLPTLMGGGGSMGGAML